MAEAKAHLKVEVSDDDTLITAIIVAARQWAEGYLNRALITQTLRLSLPGFPGEGRWDPNPESQQSLVDGVIELPMPSLQAVSSIQYVDTDGDTVTLDAGEYQVDTRRKPGRVAPAWGKSWPSTRDVFNAVSVSYTAGYGTAGSDVPACVRQAMLLMIGSMYEHREEIVKGTIIAELKLGMLPAAEALALPERIKRFL